MGPQVAGKAAPRRLRHVSLLHLGAVIASPVSARHVPGVSAAACYSRHLNGTSDEAPASWWHQLVLRTQKRHGKLKGAAYFPEFKWLRYLSCFSLFVCLFGVLVQHKVCIVAMAAAR